MKNVIRFLKWGLSIFLLLFSIFSFSEKGIISGFLFLLISVLINPVAEVALKKKHLKLKRKIFVPFAVITFFIACALAPVAEKEEVSNVLTENVTTSAVDIVSLGDAENHNSNVERSIPVTIDSKTDSEVPEPQTNNELVLLDQGNNENEKARQEQLVREQGEKEEQERLAKEQTEKEEQERLAKEQAEKEEQERLAKEQAEKEEQERLAKEQAEKEEQERLAKEQAEREEQERLAKEQAEKEEQERLAQQDQQSQTATQHSGNGGDSSNFYKYDNAEQQNTSDQWVLNTSTKKIHHPSCKDVKRIAPENYSTTNLTRSELYSMGYTDCGHCFK